MENALLADPPADNDISESAVHTCQPKPDNYLSEVPKTASDGAPELPEKGTDSNENASNGKDSKSTNVSQSNKTEI